MVRHIRAFAVASESILDGLRNIGSSQSSGDDLDTGTLDVLVRNAFRQDDETKANVPKVWSKLRSRVMGPFGKLAIEGPVFSASETASSHLSHHGRDVSTTASDGSGSPSAMDELCAVGMFHGADSHHMNLR